MDYCGRSHAEQDAPRRRMLQQKQHLTNKSFMGKVGDFLFGTSEQQCRFPNCQELGSRDPDGFYHDYCTKKHAAMHRAMIENQRKLRSKKFTKFY